MAEAQGFVGAVMAEYFESLGDRGTGEEAQVAEPMACHA